MIARLALSDFRNHADAVLHAAPGFVLLSGPNGAGKTNVLEAVSLLAPGRGLRRAALSEMARQAGPGGFAQTLVPGASPLLLPPPPPPPPPPKIEVPKIPQVNALPSYNYRPAPRPSFGDRFSKCLDDAAGAGLSPADRGTYASMCANR